MLSFPVLPRQWPNMETYLDVLFPWDIDGDNTSFCHHKEENIFALGSKLQGCYWSRGFMDNPGLVVSVKNKKQISSMPFFFSTLRILCHFLFLFFTYIWIKVESHVKWETLEILIHLYCRFIPVSCYIALEEHDTPILKAYCHPVQVFMDN